MFGSLHFIENVPVPHWMYVETDTEKKNASKVSLKM